MLACTFHYFESIYSRDVDKLNVNYFNMIKSFRCYSNIILSVYILLNIIEIIIIIIIFHILFHNVQTNLLSNNFVKKMVEIEIA